MRTLKSTRQRIKMALTSPVVVGLFVLLVLSVLLFLPSPG
jgi:type II secretory pathway component PulF